MKTLAIVAGVMLAVAGLRAHHSMSAVYDDSKQVTLRGSVTKFDWANPHVWVWVETANGNWGVEFESRTVMRDEGWSGQSLHVGDEVTVTGSAARDGSRNVKGRSVKEASGINGFEWPGSGAADPGIPAPVPPAPRWPGGHVRLGPEPGSAGRWMFVGGGMYDRTAGEITMNAEGMLTNIAAADRVAPFQPWAKAVYLHRQKNFLKDDPMAVCLPSGGPRQFQVPFGTRFLEDRDRNRVFVMSYGANRNWRNIDLDGRALPNGEDVTPTYYGYSVGRWEKDTLVVETVGLIERFWFSNGALPHTESAKLTERFTRLDFNTLRYEVTVDDPGAYTKPWTAQWSLRWSDDDPSDEYFCDDNNMEENK